VQLTYRKMWQSGLCMRRAKSATVVSAEGAGDSNVGWGDARWKESSILEGKRHCKVR
jgi:hypothetical protein